MVKEILSVLVYAVIILCSVGGLAIIFTTLVTYPKERKNGKKNSKNPEVRSGNILDCHTRRFQ